jgi:hypothetical protein
MEYNNSNSRRFFSRMKRRMNGPNHIAKMEELPEPPPSIESDNEANEIHSKIMKKDST